MQDIINSYKELKYFRDGEIHCIAVPVYNCYIAIDSNGTDLPGDLMTTISAHRGLYSVVHEISEGDTVLL